MLAFINGKITDIFDDSILIDLGIIGVEAIVGKQKAAQQSKNNMVKVYTYLHIKEQGAEIYGFFTKNELQIFRKIISVKGIGPKIALQITSSSTPKNIQNAIKNNDASFFSQIKGVGPKAAKRIILELKDKLVEDFHGNAELQEALKSLGFSSTQIKEVTNELIKQKNFYSLQIEDKIKLALKLLSKNA